MTSKLQLQIHLCNQLISKLGIFLCAARCGPLALTYMHTSTLNCWTLTLSLSFPSPGPHPWSPCLSIYKLFMWWEVPPVLPVMASTGRILSILFCTKPLLIYRLNIAISACCGDTTKYCIFFEKVSYTLRRKWGVGLEQCWEDKSVCYWCIQELQPTLHVLFSLTLTWSPPWLTGRVPLFTG